MAIIPANIADIVLIVSDCVKAGERLKKVQKYKPIIISDVKNDASQSLLCQMRFNEIGLILTS